jgi:hypothetical protein
MNPNESACLLALAQTSGDSSDLPDLHGSLLSSPYASIMDKILQLKHQLSIRQVRLFSILLSIHNIRRSGSAQHLLGMQIQNAVAILMFDLSDMPGPTSHQKHLDKDHVII